jgi:hypothetical protein
MEGAMTKINGHGGTGPLHHGTGKLQPPTEKPPAEAPATQHRLEEIAPGELKPHRGSKQDEGDFDWEAPPPTRHKLTRSQGAAKGQVDLDNRREIAEAGNAKPQNTSQTRWR